MLTWKDTLRGEKFQLCQYFKGERYKQIHFLQKILYNPKKICPLKVDKRLFSEEKHRDIGGRCKEDFCFFIQYLLNYLKFLSCSFILKNTFNFWKTGGTFFVALSCHLAVAGGIAWNDHYHWCSPYSLFHK